jgi:hypothetical protein
LLLPRLVVVRLQETAVEVADGREELPSAHSGTSGRMLPLP